MNKVDFDVFRSKIIGISFRIEINLQKTMGRCVESGIIVTVTAGVQILHSIMQAVKFLYVHIIGYSQRICMTIVKYKSDFFGIVNCLRVNQIKMVILRWRKLNGQTIQRIYQTILSYRRVICRSYRVIVAA